MKPYSGSKPYIFISYSHTDSEAVYKAINWMQHKGYRIWYDAGIVPETEYLEVISERISESKYFMAFITDDYCASKFCKRELTKAFNENISILPIYLDDIKNSRGIDLILGDIQGIIRKQFESDEDFYKKIISSNNLNHFLEEDPSKLLSEIESAQLISHCVPIEKILSAKITDKVIPLIKKAYECAYSHIPILDEKGCCIGIFDHNVWSKIISDNIIDGKGIKIDESLTFEDIAEYIDLKYKRISEIIFLGKTSTIFDAKIKTSHTFNVMHKGVGMFLITETGSKDEPLLGLLTSAGVLGRRIIE